MIKRVPVTELTTEDKQYLSIIRSDIFDACRSTDIKEICVISEWCDYAFDECLEMVEDYIYDEDNKANDTEWINERYFLNPETIAVFFVVGTDYPFAWQHIGTAASKGYMTADQLACLENNLVMVKTAMSNYKIMNKLNTLIPIDDLSNAYERLIKQANMIEELKKERDKLLANAQPNIDFSEYLDSPIEDEEEE